MKKAKWRKVVSMAVSAFMLLSTLPMYVLAAAPGSGSAQPDNGLPMGIEYRKVTGEITSGDTFTIVSSSTSDNALRIVHFTNDTTKLDRCRVTSADDTLTPTDCTMAQYAGTGAHTWTISSAEGGYTIKSQTESGKYINIDASSAQAGTEAQALQIEETQDGGLYTIGRAIGSTTYYLTYTASGWTVSTTPYPVYLYIKTEVPAEVLENGSSSTGTTTGQPFASGTGQSNNFRIPSLITLDDGSLLAAIDARWDHAGDACALDTILSKSTDGGKTWTYSFPNYFNDSTDAKHSNATAFIDPAMIQGKDGTIYLLVDLFPGGVALNTAPYGPLAKSGYELIDDAYRLVLYGSPVPNQQTSYTHYVGDFAADGYAPVIDVNDSNTDYYVDQWYYLYNADREKMYCAQLGSSKYVQQNVFYYNAELHVTAASYLWLVTSEDGGETWSAPLMLNEQVRTGLESNARFYGVGPGRGLVTSTGRIIFPCYTFYNADGNSSVIYSDDNGQTWERSEELSWQTSEATVVEADGKLYMFARHGGYAVSTDGGETWSARQNVTGADIHTGCQINAIVYSKLIDGKTAILLSCPTGSGRSNGKIYVGLVQEDGSISWDYSYSVTTGYYAYSSLTELADGSIGLLYENAGASALYQNIGIADIAPSAAIGNERSLTVPLYGEYSQIVSGGFAGYENMDTDIVDIAVNDNGDGTYIVTYTGKKEGTVKFTETTSGIEYTVTVEPKTLVEVFVEAGETENIDLTGENIEHPSDPAIASTEVTTRLYSEILGECPGSLGTDASYTGEAVGLSDAMYTFTASDNKWVISNATSDGTVYLNLSGSGQYPGKTGSATFELRAGSTAGTFKLYDTSAGRHLHFYRDGRNIFDRCATSCGTPDEMEIYRPADVGEDSSTAIPGYVQVTDANEITDEGEYLITAKAGDTYYALYPSTSTNSAYAHVIKVEPGRSLMQLAVTGVAPGITDVMVGGVVYRITVNGYETPVFQWTDDYSAVTATFNRTDSGEAQAVNCMVSSQTTEATCTADGKTIYTATVEFNGQTYTDIREVAVSATGHAYGEPIFTWSEDHSSCNVAVSCSSCQDSATFDCQVSSQTTEATATTAGSTVYTAEVSVNGKSYSSTVTVTIPAAGTNTPSTGGGGSNSGNNANNNSGTATPKTGDTAPYLMLYIIVLAGCGAVIVRSWKRCR